MAAARTSELAESLQPKNMGAQRNVRVRQKPRVITNETASTQPPSNDAETRSGYSNRTVDLGPAALGRDEVPSALEMAAEPIERSTPSTANAYTSVFGVEAEGRRFAYVFDRSGSMGQPDGRPLQAAKDELLKSLSRLDTVHQFFLIFYNELPRVFNPAVAPGRLVFATDDNKDSARRFVEAVTADGGTKHYDALLVAIRLRPDVIFLLTDGEPKDDLSDEELAYIRRLNDGIAQIYVVQFSSRQYEANSLVRLAKENRGEHTYLDIRKEAAK